MIYKIEINLGQETLYVKESDIDQIVEEEEGHSIYLKRPLKYNDGLGFADVKATEISVIYDVESISLVDIPLLDANVRLKDR